MKKLLSVLLVAVLVLSMATTSFASTLFGKNQDKADTITPEQERLLHALENQARADAKQSGDYGEFEDRLYNREFDGNVNTPKATAKPAPKATEPAKTTTKAMLYTPASVANYFKKYFNNKVVVAKINPDGNGDDVYKGFEKDIVDIAKGKMSFYYYDAKVNEYYFIGTMNDINDADKIIKKIESDEFAKDFISMGVNEDNAEKYGFLITTNGPLVKK